MAVEEVEYFSFTQGNGVSGGVRDTKTKQVTKKKPKAAARQGGRFTSFFQGITLGTVLLIPVGVWCWVRMDEIAVVTEPSPSLAKTPAAGKGKSVAVKRKAVKPLAVAVPAPRITEVDMMKARSLVDAEPLPLPVATPEPAAVPVTTRLPRVTEDEFGNAPANKKGVWKAITSPFRGKGKSEAPPPGAPREQ